MAQFFPNAGVLYTASTMQAALADSKLRLFKAGFTPSISTTQAELVANEADYTGYPAGGVVLDEWFPPVFNPAGGASIDSPAVQFRASSPYTITNVIGGWWVETLSPNSALIAIGTFSSGIPLGAQGQGFPINLTLVWPNGF